jgi:hypothetical protein
MRIDAAGAVLAAAVSACAHGAPPARDVHAAPTRDACDAYGAQVIPSLERIAAAADRFSDAVTADARRSARAGRELADELVLERGRLEAIRVADPSLAARHRQMTSALAELAETIRFLADAVADGDPARRSQARERLHRADETWEQAARSVRAACPPPTS